MAKTRPRTTEEIERYELDRQWALWWKGITDQLDNCPEPFMRLYSPKILETGDSRDSSKGETNTDGPR